MLSKVIGIIGTAQAGIGPEEAVALTGAVAALQLDVRVAVAGPSLLTAVAGIVADAQGKVTQRVCGLINVAEDHCKAALDSVATSVDMISAKLGANPAIANAALAAQAWNNARVDAVSVFENCATTIEAHVVALQRTQDTLRKYVGDKAAERLDINVGRELVIKLRRVAVSVSEAVPTAPDASELLQHACKGITDYLSQVREKVGRLCADGRATASATLQSHVVDTLVSFFDGAAVTARLDIHFSLVDAAKAALGGNGNSFQWASQQWQRATYILQHKLAGVLRDTLAVSACRDTCRALGEAIASSIATVSSLALQAGTALSGAWEQLAKDAGTALQALGHKVGSHLLGSVAIEGLAKGFGAYSREWWLSGASATFSCYQHLQTLMPFLCSAAFNGV